MIDWSSIGTNGSYQERCSRCREWAAGRSPNRSTSWSSSRERRNCRLASLLDWYSTIEYLWPSPRIALCNHNRGQRPPSMTSTATTVEDNHTSLSLVLQQWSCATLSLGCRNWWGRCTVNREGKREYHLLNHFRRKEKPLETSSKINLTTSSQVGSIEENAEEEALSNGGERVTYEEDNQESKTGVLRDLAKLKSKWRCRFNSDMIAGLSFTNEMLPSGVGQGRTLSTSSRWYTGWTRWANGLNLSNPWFSWSPSTA